MIPHFCFILTERPHCFPMEFMSESVWISTCLVASFRSCVLSWFFLWHLVWLSVMQLRHYLFIGTLNPMLNRLANDDPSLGNHQNHLFYSTLISWLWYEVFPLLICIISNRLLFTFFSSSFLAPHLPQWVSTPMLLPWHSCVECCVLPGTGSLWTDTRESLWLLVKSMIGDVCVFVW